MQVGLEVIAEGAGQNVDDERRIVDATDAGEAREIEDHSAVQRDRPAAHTAATRRRGHRNCGLVADAQHGLDLVDRGRRRDGGRQLSDLPFERPRHGQWPPIAAGLTDGVAGGGHRGARIAESAQQSVVDRYVFGVEPGRRLAGAACDRDRGCRRRWPQFVRTHVMPRSRASIAVSGSSGALRSSSMRARYAATWRACSSASQPRSSASSACHVGCRVGRRVARRTSGHECGVTTHRRARTPSRSEPRRSPRPSGRASPGINGSASVGSRSIMASSVRVSPPYRLARCSTVGWSATVWVPAAASTSS